jgi:antitoxin component YwqK of YwqJK toxin-antitoxin module
MKKNDFILFIILCLSTGVYAQVSADKEKKYADKYKELLEKDGKLLFVDYYTSIEKVKGAYFRKTYNPDKLITTQCIVCEDEMCAIRNGPYVERYDNGKLWKVGAYKNDTLVGIWKYYDYSHTKLEYGGFKDNLKDGLWIVEDSLGNVMKTSSYKNGLRHGELIQYDSIGHVQYILNYTQDSVTSQKILDSLSYEKDFNLIDDKPMMKICSDLVGEEKENCRKTEYLKYMYKNIRYPEVAVLHEIEGQAIFYFIVDKNGRVSDIIVYRGLCKEIEKECLRILNSFPDWSPGIKNNEPVKVAFKMPITFRLE